MIFRIAIDYFGIAKRWCPRSEIHEHAPHFWYDQDVLRRFFCNGRA